VVPNIEHYEYLPRPGQLRDPWPRTPHPDILGYSRADYGNRIGFWRMLEVIDRYQVPCTACLNLACYEYFPEIMEACEARRWDVCCHGIHNTEYLWGLSMDEERTYIAKCIASHLRLTGRTFDGWFSPAGTFTINTPDLVAEAGIKYYCDWRFDEQPFPLQVKTGRLLAMPYQLEVNDGVNFRFAVEAQAWARAAIEMFDRLYADGTENGRVMHLAIHPFLMGQPHRIVYFDRVLKHIAGHRDVWMATGAEIADWYIAHYLPLVA
jgi:peptidoglycan/xylan/chitin deacetylase (PgdA/CDA1 family)